MFSSNASVSTRPFCHVSQSTVVLCSYAYTETNKGNVRTIVAAFPWCGKNQQEYLILAQTKLLILREVVKVAQNMDQVIDS
jgi:hypothetical protein